MWYYDRGYCWCLVTKSCPTPCDPVDCTLPDSSVRGFPGQECWSGLHAIFLTQGLNLCLLHWQADSLLLSHQAASAAKLLQLCLIVCDPIDGSPPGSTIPGILQARTLECVAISFSNAWKWKVKVKSLSCVQLLATPWTPAYHAALSMGFSRQEYWSGLPLPSLEPSGKPRNYGSVSLYICQNHRIHTSNSKLIIMDCGWSWCIHVGSPVKTNTPLWWAMLIMREASYSSRQEAYKKSL